MKRLLDFFAAFFGLLITSPLMVPVCIAIWLQDWHSPFYIADRVGVNGKLFRMVKLRSMVMNAAKIGGDSTGGNDPRITAVGRFIRAYKLDEIPQLWNVLKGEMSLVGPRPNVKNETDRYTDEENKLLLARPGITDLASIVFSDEGDILKDSDDADLDYNRLIRPWKSRLGIFYVAKRTFFMDIRIILLTIQAIISKPAALDGVHKILVALGADEELIEVSKRQKQLVPHPPPGTSEIVTAV